MGIEARRGGIVVNDGKALLFVPAQVAQRIVPMPEIGRVPGTHPDLVGITLVEGTVLPVVSIGEARSAMLVIGYMGESIGIVGVTVVASGSFETLGDADSVVCDTHVAKPLDLAAIYGRLKAGSWAGRSPG